MIKKLLLISVLALTSCSTKSLIYHYVASKEEPASIRLFVNKLDLGIYNIEVMIDNKSPDTLILPYLVKPCNFYLDNDLIRLDFPDYVEYQCNITSGDSTLLASIDADVKFFPFGNYLIPFVIIPPKKNAIFSFHGLLEPRHEYHIEMILIMNTSAKAPLYERDKDGSYYFARVGTADFWSTAGIGVFKTKFHAPK
ncbi:hypothetical protein K1X84_07230 [bacterium]|nr:hypothetical protein [bacterium]